MLKFLLLIPMIFYLGCTEIRTTPSSINIEIANPTQGAVNGPIFDDPSDVPFGVTLTVEPPDVEGPPGNSVWVTVSAFENGIEVPSFDVESAVVVNTQIASTLIDGRQVQYRLLSPGVTSSTITALEATVSVSIWVR